MTAGERRTPAEVARATFDAVIAKEPRRIVAGGAPDYVDDFVPGGLVPRSRRRPGLLPGDVRGFPDFEMAVDRIVADDSSAVVQWHARNVQRRPASSAFGPTDAGSRHAVSTSWRSRTG